MAEAGTGKTFSKVLQRTVFRTREKVLQNLGKADKTTDDQFEQHVLYFNEQQAAAARLQKELKHYAACVKEMSLASQSMYRTIKEVYEPEWTGFTEVTAAVEQLQTLWEDYVTKVNDQLQAPLVVYALQFQDVKTKIAKRSRKLTDYDSARHTCDSLVAAKKPDEAKITKATEDMNEAKHIYETINVELSEELPALFSSRVPFIASHVNKLCTIESVFQHESAKLKDMVISVTENLCQESAGMQRKIPSTSGLQSPSTGLQTQMSTGTGGRASPGFNFSGSSGIAASSRSPAAASTPTATSSTPPRLNNTPPSPSRPTQDGLARLAQLESSISDIHYEVKAEQPPSVRMSGGSSSEPSSAQIMYNGKPADTEPLAVDMSETQRRVAVGNLPSTVEVHSADGAENNKHDSNGAFGGSIHSNGNLELKVTETERESDVKPAEPAMLPLTAALASQDVVPEHRVLFKVQATHKYVGEDLDELTFDVGEIITVVPFDDPEEQDDGWLMGVKEHTKEKGVFPENFTKRL